MGLKSRGWRGFSSMGCGDDRGWLSQWTRHCCIDSSLQEQTSLNQRRILTGEKKPKCRKPLFAQVRCAWCFRISRVVPKGNRNDQSDDGSQPHVAINTDVRINERTQTIGMRFKRFCVAMKKSQLNCAGVIGCNGHVAGSEYEQESIVLGSNDNNSELSCSRPN